jgi:nitroreductase
MLRSFENAPVLIIALCGEYKSVAGLILSKKGRKDPVAMKMIEDRRSAPTRIQQMGGFIVQLLLVLHSFGLGACWMGGPLIAKSEIEEIVGISEGWDLAALIPVGFPDETPPIKPRKTIDELVSFIT